MKHERRRKRQAGASAAAAHPAGGPPGHSRAGQSGRSIMLARGVFVAAAAAAAAAAGSGWAHYKALTHCKAPVGLYKRALG